MAMEIPTVSHEITFTMDEDDVIAFSDYHWATSPTLRTTARKACFLTPALSLSFALMFWLLDVNETVVFFFSVFGLTWLLLYPSLLRSRRRSNARKLYREGRNTGNYGLQLLRAEPDGLHKYSDVVEGRMAWVVLEKIGQTAEHVFLYLGAMAAVPICRAKVHAGDLNAFIAACETFRAAAGDARFVVGEHTELDDAGHATRR